VNSYSFAWLIIVPLILLVGPRVNKWLTITRFLAAILIGWILIHRATILYWSMEITNAVSKEQILEVTAHDGGPKAFAYVFGWIPAIIYAGVWLGGVHLFKTINRKKQTSFWRT